MECPGVPMESGFRPLSEEQQEQWRATHRELQRSIIALIEDVDRCRHRALALSITAVIG